MNTWTLDQIMQATQGRLISRVYDECHGFSTDTRADCAKTLFMALRGESFDAHKFLGLAVQKKAAIILVDQEAAVSEDLKSQASFVLVSDTLKALQDMAHWHRKQMPARVIGITGSNGKTSTKEFMARIIETQKQVVYSKGSFNNHWGVPFSLLQVEPQHEVALIEMGMNHAGEITELVQIAKPDVVVCTMVGRAHIEHFGSVEKIAAAKEEIYESSYDRAVRIYNLDDPMTLPMYEKSQTKFSGPKITFSANNSRADVYLQVRQMTLESLVIEGQILGMAHSISVPVFGRQNLTNLMAAAAGAVAVGLSAEQVWRGLGLCKTVWGRNQLMKNSEGVQILFDGYNANPDSMKALLENIKQVHLNGNKIGVFGQMLEMGDHSLHFHEELGIEAARAGLNKVYFYGQDYEAFKKGFLKVQGAEGQFLKVQKEFTSELAEDLKRETQAGDLVLVKGSRGMKLERMVEPLNPLGFAKKDEGTH